jgi:hypothetical protein
MKDKKDKPDASEYGQRRAFLAMQGFKKPELDALMGNVGEKTRGRLSLDLISFQSELPGRD